MSSSDESDYDTLATLSRAGSVAEDEDVNGDLLTEDSGRQLLSLISAIRENDPSLYENLQFDENIAKVDKDSIFDDYFTGVESAQQEKLKKKEKQKKQEEKQQKKSEKKVAIKDKVIESKADQFLTQFIASTGWKFSDQQSSAIDLGDDQEAEMEKIIEAQQKLDAEKAAEIEKRDLEEAEKVKRAHQEKNLTKFRHLEEGALNLQKYPLFTKEDGSVREGKPSKKKVQRQNKNEAFKAKVALTEEENEKIRTKLIGEIVQGVKELKESIKGSNSDLDKMELNPDDDTQAFEQIEAPKIYDELVFGSLDVYGDYKESREIVALVKEIRKKFEDFYGTFVEDRQSDLNFRFHYKKVDKEDFGMTVNDILQHDDEELETVLPYQSIRAKDECGVELNKKQIKQNVIKLRKGLLAKKTLKKDIQPDKSDISQSKSMILKRNRANVEKPSKKTKHD